MDAPGQPEICVVMVLGVLVDRHGGFFGTSVVIGGLLANGRSGRLIGVLCHADLLADVFTMEITSGYKKI